MPRKKVTIIERKLGRTLALPPLDISFITGLFFLPASRTRDEPASCSKRVWSH